MGVHAVAYHPAPADHNLLCTWRGCIEYQGAEEVPRSLLLPIARVQLVADEIGARLRRGPAGDHGTDGAQAARQDRFIEPVCNRRRLRGRQYIASPARQALRPFELTQLARCAAPDVAVGTDGNVTASVEVGCDVGAAV